jgi:hypothetical protein
VLLDQDNVVVVREFESGGEEERVCGSLNEVYGG